VSSPRAALIGFVVASWLVAAPCRAQSDDERAAARLFRAGAAAFEQRDYTAAANAFEEANRRMPRGATVYNAALAWEAAGERARSADGYAAALEDASLAREAADDARRRLAVLAPSLGIVDVSADAGCVVSVAHVRDARPPKKVHLASGEHVVSARCGSLVRRQRVGVTPGAIATVAFPPNVIASERPAPTATTSSARTFGFVSLGGALALTGTGAFLGSAALGARSDFDASGRTDADARSDAVALRTWANVAFAGAIVLAATGLYLLFRPR
jgi:tetratricopeptide (TPR) repeat protein